jgi:hypothetical protein
MSSEILACKFQIAPTDRVHICVKRRRYIIWEDEDTLFILVLKRIDVAY